MEDVPTCLHKAYDQTTPQGTGGDPEQARMNNQAFNASYAIIHAGMKDLSDISQVKASLLFFYHTHCATENDKDMILKEMAKHFWQRVDSKGMHQTTMEKVPAFLEIVLDYTKAYITGNPDKKEAIAGYLGVQENWYRKDRKTCWNEWFESMVAFLRAMEDDGLDFMHTYCLELHREKKRVKLLSRKIKLAWEAA